MWQICGAVNQWNVSHVTKGRRGGRAVKWKGGGGESSPPISSSLGHHFVLEGGKRRAAVRNHSHRKLRFPIDPQVGGGVGKRGRGGGGASRSAHVVITLPAICQVIYAACRLHNWPVYKLRRDSET